MRSLLFSLLLVFQVAIPVNAQAGLPRLEDQEKSDIRRVLMHGAYGAGIGAAAGLLSHALGSGGRSVFVGASVGLYLGLAIGLMRVLGEDPLAAASSPGLKPGTPEWEANSTLAALKHERRLPFEGMPPLLETRFSLFRF